MSARIHSVETIIVSHGLNFVYLFFMQIDGISTNVFLIESPGGGMERGEYPVRFKRRKYSKYVRRPGRTNTIIIIIILNSVAI